MSNSFLTQSNLNTRVRHIFFDSVWLNFQGYHYLKFLLVIHTIIHTYNTAWKSLKNTLYTSVSCLRIIFYVSLSIKVIHLQLSAHLLIEPLMVQNIAQVGAQSITHWNHKNFLYILPVYIIQGIMGTVIAPLTMTLCEMIWENLIFYLF